MSRVVTYRMLRLTDGGWKPIEGESVEFEDGMARGTGEFSQYVVENMREPTPRGLARFFANSTYVTVEPV